MTREEIAFNILSQESYSASNYSLYILTTEDSTSLASFIQTF